MGPTTVKTENSQPGLSLGPSSRVLLLSTRVAAARLRSRDGGALAGSVFFPAKLPGGLGGEEPGTMRAATEARACPSGPLGLALSGKSWAPTPGAVARGRGASGPSYQFKEARSLPTGIVALRRARLPSSSTPQAAGEHIFQHGNGNGRASTDSDAFKWCVI